MERSRKRTPIIHRSKGACTIGLVLRWAARSSGLAERPQATATTPVTPGRRMEARLAGSRVGPPHGGATRAGDEAAHEHGRPRPTRPRHRPRRRRKPRRHAAPSPAPHARPRLSRPRRRPQPRRRRPTRRPRRPQPRRRRPTATTTPTDTTDAGADRHDRPPTHRNHAGADRHATTTTATTPAPTDTTTHDRDRTGSDHDRTPTTTGPRPPTDPTTTDPSAIGANPSAQVGSSGSDRRCATAAAHLGSDERRPVRVPSSTTPATSGNFA